jgi:hypothetical protein
MIPVPLGVVEDAPLDVEFAYLPLVVGIKVSDPVPGMLLEPPVPVPIGYVG